MRCVLAAVVACAVLGACSSSPPGASGPTTTPSTNPTPRLTFVLDDAGLHEPAGPVDAGPFDISFTDRRSQRPPDQRVSLRVRPSGPIIVVAEIPAGATKTVTLLANEVFEVAFDGVTDRHIPQIGSLDIRTSAQYPTPAT
jgi:hypothetical protein